jgi:predicted SAM-dependent methyltransferase
MNLILCAGERKLPEFKTHDIQGEHDYLCDLFDLPVEKQSCDVIHFTHALEHFPTAKTETVLDFIYSLLKPGGKLYIEVPNFAWHAKLIAEGRDRDAVYYAFGGQKDEWDFHKTGFTPSILLDELENAGFKNIEIQNGSSLCAWMSK